MESPTPIVIIDDHDQVRQALATCLASNQPDVAVVGEAGDIDAGRHLVQALHPAVVVVETKRSDGRGLELVHWIVNGAPGTQVIVLTSYRIEWEEWAAQRAGAARYLLKDIDCPSLARQIRDVAALRPAAPVGRD